MITIELRNLKGIKKLIYSIPDKSGVYILSGTNGCGKTSLLTAIDRIGNNLAFNNFANCNRNSSISYEVDGEKVVYTKKDKRWSPKPKNVEIL
jgi:predicted ATP-binding protein involved in virulence